MGMNKKTILVLLTASLLIGSLINCSKSKSNDPVSNESIKPAIDNKSIEVFGIVTTTVIENINIDFPAKIEKIHVKEGQKVKLGDTLVSLSIEDYKSMIRSKENELETAKYELSTSQLEYEKLQKDLGLAEEDLKNKKEYYNNLKVIFDSGNASKKDLDDAELAFRAKEKELNQIEIFMKKYTDVNNILEMQKDRINNIELDLEQYKSKLNMKNLKGNTIVSNVKNGIIYDIGYSNGDYIIPTNQNFKKILSIMDMDSLII